MRRDEVIEILQRHRDEFEQRYGVKSLALFGSVARDDAKEVSDIDLLVEFDGRPISLFHLGGLHQRISEILQAPKIDLVMRDSIIPALKDRILGGAVNVVGTQVGVSH